MKLRRLLEFMSDTAVGNGEPPVRLVLGTVSFYQIRDELIAWRAPTRWPIPPIEATEFMFEHVIIERSPEL